MVMSIRLDTCMEALRSLARSSELEANRLPTAELRVRDFLTPVGTNRAAQRAALEELDNAVSRRDKLYREALRMELAAAGEDLKKLREIARVHIEKAAGGDMQAIKELADRLDGRPAQILEHSGP